MKLNKIALIIILLNLNILTAQENPFLFKWDKGFKVENKDKSLKFKFGGRLMLDHAFMQQDNDLDFRFGELETTSAVEIRRARLFFSGTVYDHTEFKLDLAFEGGIVALKDVYLGIKNIPIIGTIRVGYVKEPFRFEMLTSSKYLTFMERSLISDYAPTRNQGVLLMNEFKDNRISYQAALFRNADSKTGNDEKANDGYVFTGRVTGLPINNVIKKQLLHLGLGYSYRVSAIREYNITSKPESHLSGIEYIDTGIIEDVDHVNLINIEAVFTQGPFIAQAEYLTSKVNANISYNFASYYAQISYFLTGEHKKYKSSYGGFDRLKPKNNFGRKEYKGLGAWEAALRYSNSDYTSKDILGGEQTNITLGVNWYLNPVTKIAFNHIFINVINQGNASIFQVRLQLDF
ncbi:MAG: hypothetical protein L3J23_04905 [Flavobacteriaceae bacterium]|nr:hypothetical protein [Flavobacteriaceae bacterium]